MSDDATLDEFAQEVDGYENQKSQNWSEVKLQEVVYKRSENVDPQEVYLHNHVGLEHIEPNSPIPDWESLDDLSSTKRKFESGDILFAKLRPNLEKAAQPEFDGVASTDIFPIVAEQDINQKYLLYRLSSKPAFDYARRTSAGTRMPRTSWNLFNNFEFGLPSLSEQRKIATVLHTVDQAIQKTQQIETQLQRTQDGLIQTFLNEGIGNSEIRETKTKLGQIPEHWEVATIDEIIADEEDAFTDGARYSLSSAEIHSEGDARAILLEEVGEADFRDTTPKFATQKKYEEITHRAIYQGEVVVAKMAEPVARACIVPETYDKYLLGCADVVRIVPNDEVDDRFLMYCMNSHIVWRQAVAHLRGTGRSRINLENIAELKIPKPPLSEQEQIAEILHEYDRKIENERAYQNQLQLLKHGLMQDLLSGEVRTTDAKIKIPEEVAKHG
jgi:type I restriction enzyme S subunit